MSDFSEALVKETTRPPKGGLGAPLTGFVGTVIGTGPLRVQSSDGVDVEAIAVTGYTPANGHNVLVTIVGSRHYARQVP